MEKALFYFVVFSSVITGVLGGVKLALIQIGEDFKPGFYLPAIYAWIFSLVCLLFPFVMEALKSRSGDSIGKLASFGLGVASFAALACVEFAGQAGGYENAVYCFHCAAQVAIFSLAYPFIGNYFKLGNQRLINRGLLCISFVLLVFGGWCSVYGTSNKTAAQGNKLPNAGKAKQTLPTNAGGGGALNEETSTQKQEENKAAKPTGNEEEVSDANDTDEEESSFKSAWEVLSFNETEVEQGGIGGHSVGEKTGSEEIKTANNTGKPKKKAKENEEDGGKSNKKQNGSIVTVSIKQPVVGQKIGDKTTSTNKKADQTESRKKPETTQNTIIQKKKRPSVPIVKYTRTTSGYIARYSTQNGEFIKKTTHDQTGRHIMTEFSDGFKTNYEHYDQINLITGINYREDSHSPFRTTFYDANGKMKRTELLDSSIIMYNYIGNWLFSGEYFNLDANWLFETIWPNEGRFEGDLS